MGRRVIRGDLSEEGIQSIIDQLNAYKVDLNRKCELFTQRLADRGIMTARMVAGGGYGRYIQFYRESKPLGNAGFLTVMVATNTGLIHREWLTQEGVKEVDVSPLLMAEYGAGQYAVDGHRGTFPGQTHAFDDVWYWQDLDHVWHASKGTIPTRPVYHAWLEMANILNDVAREVFYG